MQKVLFSILSFVLWCQIAQGQSLPQAKRATNAIRLNIEDNNFSSGQTFSKLSLKLPITDLKGQPSTFETRDFKIKEQNPETDPYGLQHYHYTQTINGIEVDGAEMRVHVKNGTVESQTGHWLLEVPARLQQLRATQSTDAILQTVRASLKDQKLTSHDLLGNMADGRAATNIPDNAKLVYVPIGKNLDLINPDSVRLAYRFTIKTGAFGKFMYYIDATNGELLYKIDMVCRIMGNKQHTHTVACDAGTAPSTKTSKISSPTITETDDPKSTLWTQYSGSQRTTTTKRSDGKWALKDLNRNIEVVYIDSSFYDGKTQKDLSSNYLNNSNQWKLASANDFDGFAHDALWGAQVTYDYFKNTLGKWLYTSGKFGQKLRIYANTDFRKTEGFPNSINAYYDGDKIVIGMGDPDNGINPLSTLDITAHEIVHGITANTSGLAYINESGAINEALSDIFGTVVERYKRPQRWNWTMGEDMGETFRSMSNPRAYRQPSEYGGQYFLNYVTDPDTDIGGVHINSGIMNRWFYLLCEGGKGTNEAGNAYDVQAIGMDAAAKILWLAQQEYITSSMNFYNVSNATFKAARAIFGGNANQTLQLQNAWIAVNVSKKAVFKNCSDTHGPNNSYKQSTKISVNTPVQGNLSDFAYSIFNKGSYYESVSNKKFTPNPEQYTDWYTFTTTNDKPNIQIEYEKYFLDQLAVSVYKDVNGKPDYEATPIVFIKASDIIDPTSLTVVDVSTPENNVKGGQKYYIKVAYGDLEDETISYQAIHPQSDGCYKLTVKASSKPFDIKDDDTYLAMANVVDNQIVVFVNQNEEEIKQQKVLSVEEGKQLQEGAKVVQRSYDKSADQIWHITNRTLKSENGSNNYFFSIKNLNSDKILDYDIKGGATYQTSSSNRKVDINLEHNYIIDSNFSESKSLVLEVMDELSNSSVNMVSRLSGKGAESGASSSKDRWQVYYAPLSKPGQYILRSVKDKKALTLINGKTLQAKTFTEDLSQKWNLVYDKDGRYVITSAATGKAINLTNGNAAENATYDLATPNTKQETQRWKVLPTGVDGSFKLANSSNNKTLNSKTNGTIAQNTYNGSSEQRWYLDKIEKIKEGYYFLQNRANSLYMDVRASLKQDGATMISHSYNGGYNQLFHVQPQTDGTYIIEAVHSEKAISTNASQKLAQPYQWATDARKTNQRWKIVYTSDGYFKIISEFNRMALQAGEEANKSGSKTPIVLNTYIVGNNYQQWKFNVLGSVVDKTVQTLTENTLSDSYNAEQGMLSISPNPAENEVSIAYDLSADEEANVELLTSTGMPIMHKTAGKKETILDISQVPTGVYLISLETNTGKKITQKLVVQK